MPDKESVITVIKHSDYRQLFLDVYGKDAFDDVEAAYNNFARAVAAYERSSEVTSFTSQYDAGEFTGTEALGLTTFEEKCAVCHSTAAAWDAPAALFTNYQYFNIGIPANPLVPLLVPDPGLGATVGDSTQDGKFKVPTLRNVAASAPYSHNGYFATLEDMINFINDNSGFVPEIGRNLDGRVGNMNLTVDEIEALEAFLMTLTDGY